MGERIFLPLLVRVHGPNDWPDRNRLEQTQRLSVPDTGSLQMRMRPATPALDFRPARRHSPAP
jgi:hypothetical protein